MCGNYLIPDAVSASLATDSGSFYCYRIFRDICPGKRKFHWRIARE